MQDARLRLAQPFLALKWKQHDSECISVTLKVYHTTFFSEIFYFTDFCWDWTERTGQTGQTDQHMDRQTFLGKYCFKLVFKSLSKNENHKNSKIDPGFKNIFCLSSQNFKRQLFPPSFLKIKQKMLSFSDFFLVFFLPSLFAQTLLSSVLFNFSNNYSIQMLILRGKGKSKKTNITHVIRIDPFPLSVFILKILEHNGWL